jgi:hypothetical protein
MRYERRAGDAPYPSVDRVAADRVPGPPGPPAVGVGKSQPARVGQDLGGVPGPSGRKEIVRLLGAQDRAVSEQGGDLKEILEELILLVERELTKMNLRLRPLLVDTPRVQANPGALRRLLFELLFRLAETMPRSSELIIQTRFDAEAAEVLLGSAPAPFSPERLEEIIGRTLAEVPSLCGQGQGFELRANDEALSGPQLLIRLALAPTPQTRDAVAAEEQT